MKPNSNIHKAFLAIISSALQTGDEVMEMFKRPSAVMKYGYDDWKEMQWRMKKRERDQAIQRLQKQKYLKLSKHGDRIVARLTKSGKIQALIEKMQRETVELPGNQLCLVSYDIAEGMYRVRHEFRRALKRIGFQSRQRSVWATKKNVVKEVQYLADALKLTKQVDVYVAFIC